MIERTRTHVTVAACLGLLITTAASRPASGPLAARLAEPAALSNAQEPSLEDRIQHFVRLHYDDARGRLEAGEYEGALDQVRKGLARAPYDLEGYSLALEIATAAEDPEAQLQWAAESWERADRSPKSPR